MSGVPEPTRLRVRVLRFKLWLATISETARHEAPDSTRSRSVRPRRGGPPSTLITHD